MTKGGQECAADAFVGVGRDELHVARIVRLMLVTSRVDARHQVQPRDEGREQEPVAREDVRADDAHRRGSIRERSEPGRVCSIRPGPCPATRS